MAYPARLAALGYRLAGWPRRVATVLCLLLAAGSALAARSPAAAPAGGSLDVVVAARDLAVGAALEPGDLRVAEWPASVRPSSAVSRPDQLTGRRLSGALRAGEAVTSTRLMGGTITAGLPAGFVAVPVELTGTFAAALVQPGDWVDVLAGPASSDGDPAASTAHVVAVGVRILAVSQPAPGTGAEGTPIVVAADRTTALRLAAAAAGTVLVTVRTPP